MKKAHSAKKIVIPAILCAAMLVTIGSAYRADADSSQVSDFNLPVVSGPYNINACVGANSTSLAFSWFTQEYSTPQIKIAPASQMNGNTFPSTAKVQSAVQLKVTATENISQSYSALGTVDGGASVSNYMDNVFNGKTPSGTFTGEYESKATINGLKSGTKYSYCVSDGEGGWSPVYKISTLPSDKVTFAAFGDPQLGAFDDASGKAKDDATGGHKSEQDDKTAWGNMLGLVAKNQNLNFLFSLGDQINDYSNLISPTTANGGQWNEYNSFFNPSSAANYIQSYPLAVFSGNHDHQMGEYYGYHYNQPTRSSLGSTEYGNDGDYWFTAGPVLFMVLNANNYGTADHDQFMSEAIQKNPNAKWRVAAWHQSAYSEANHNTSNSIDDPVLTIRNTWPHLMDKYHVDVVLQGHDHYYTRTAQMLGGSVVDPKTGKAEILSANTGSSIPGTTNSNATYATKNYPASVTNPKGTVYFTLDSGSGSKYYNLNTGMNDTIGGSSDHSFSVVGWQGYLPTYSLVSFTNSTFTIKTYSSSDFTTVNQSLIDSYTITKTSK